MAINILIADDDEVLRELICDIFAKEGFITKDASDGQQALDLFFASNEIDLLILDVMMPKYDGWEVLKEVRSHSDVPVIMLTALGDEQHEVFGLKKGADDYIAKPFSYEVFVARVHSQLRRIRKERTVALVVGDLVIDRATQKVKLGSSSIDLNRKEYGLLLYLANNKNRVLTREQILNHVWGYDFDGDIRTIDTHIKTLRSKLLTCGGYIRTVRGTGYMLEVGTNEDD